MYESFQELARFMKAGGPLMWPLAGAAGLLWYALAWRLLHLRAAPVLGAARQRALGVVQRGGVDLAPRIEVALSDVRSVLGGRRGLVRILVTAAPLGGLLGTVSGMIETFDGLAEGALHARTGGVAGGISQALLTTQMGLMVAVPGVIIGRLLDKRQHGLEAQLDQLRAEAADGRLRGTST